MLTRCAVLFGLVAVTQGKMDGFIVDGDYASITQFPHSAALAVHCMTTENNKTISLCGSSILNQRILLTAGHCLHKCQDGTFIAVNLGDESRYKGVTRSAHTYIVHEHYITKTLENDIALVRMKKSVKLNSKASRVAILRNPPYNEPAAVAGWGRIYENQKIKSPLLKYVAQIVRNREECSKRIGRIPPGTLCASNKHKSRHPARGDSGSALVVRHYIQIGLVSFGRPSVSSSIVGYTDIGYFYDWISFNVEKLYCLNKLSWCFK